MLFYDIENIKKHITCNEDTKQKLMWLSITGGNCYVPEQSLLSIASRYGNIEIMKYLISLGTDVDDLDEYACTPLHFACLKRKENNINHDGSEEYNYFLAVLFSDKELEILDYNRVVRDLNGHTPEEFLEALNVS